MAKVRANGRWNVPGASGGVADGWKVNCYIAGTSTRKDTYTTSDESVANPNPVILNARGEAIIFWSGTYKIVVTDKNDVTVWTEDNYGAGEDQSISGNYNLVKNGSFELQTVTSGEPDDWTIVDYSGGSHSLDSTDQFHGLYSLKFVSTGTGGGYGTTDYFEVQEAKTVPIDWAMKSSVVGVRNVVDVLWYTAAKTLISTTNVYDDSTTNPTSWTEKAAEATPPSTARFCQIRVYGAHSSDVTAGATWYDDIQVSTDNNAKRNQSNTFTGINTFTKTQTWAKGADIASAAALTVGSDGNYFDVTGTTAITSIATVGIGTVIKLHFDGILTLTNHATDLILPGGADITTAAGDEAEFIEYATGDWRCTNYFDDKIVAYDGAGRSQTLDAAFDFATGLKTINAASLIKVDVKLTEISDGSSTISIDAGISKDFLLSGIYALNAPLGIVVEYYMNGSWATDSVFDGSATKTGIVLQANQLSSSSSSMRLRNTTSGTLSVYYHSLILPTV